MCTKRRCFFSSSDRSCEEQRGLDGPGHKALHRMPLPGVLDRDLPCHRQHCALGCRIGGLRGRGAQPGDERGDIDDGAASGLEHRRDAELASERDPLSRSRRASCPRSTRRSRARYRRLATSRRRCCRARRAGRSDRRPPRPSPGHRLRSRRPRERRGLARRSHLAVVPPASSFTSVSTTLAPSRAKSSAATLPMPLPPPVINATLSSSRITEPPGRRTAEGYALGLRCARG